MIVLREFIIATLMEFAKTKLVVLYAHALNYIVMLVTKLVINAKEMGYTSSHRLSWPIKMGYMICDISYVAYRMG